MMTIFINDMELKVSENKNILQIARENNIDIPALCFLEDCNNIGQCGVCLVEVIGQEKLSRACCLKPKDGMRILTNSEKVLNERTQTISKLLDKHDFKCGKCNRKDSCEFLKLVIKTKARASKPFVPEEGIHTIDDRSKSIVMNRSKCLTCGRCVATCKTKVGTKAITFQKHNDTRVVGAENLNCFDDTNCILCGQCVVSCPVDALSEKSHIERIEDAIKDKDTHVIVAIAPSVRTAMGEMFGMGYGVDVTGKVYTALKMLGFDKVFDLNFAADITIIEEASELIERISTGGPFPMFTSCCPAWIRLVENYYPELLKNISTVKSPQQIFGAASKTYYSKITGIEPKNIFTVSIMPCIAKKYEADKPEMESDDVRHIDAVLTTRELGRLIKKAKIDFPNLSDSIATPAMGMYSGAGTIFGATGGVMEAALRTAKDYVEGESFKDIEYEMVRGLSGIKEATVNIKGSNYNIAVINGASNLFEFMKSGKMQEKQYHFIEVMACNGGCVNGGGQPHVPAKEKSEMDIRSLRASVLYNQDKSLPRRKSHQNEAVFKMYATYMGMPGKSLAHKLFHTKHIGKK